MNRSDIKSWNEFDWEKLFREEDGRIQAYMKDLPLFIDLPGEDDILMSRVTDSQNDMDLADILSEYYFDEFDNDENDFVATEKWQDRHSGETYQELLGIASCWCRIYSSKAADNHDSAKDLTIICMFGMLLSKVLYIMETPDELKPLLAAHWKRLGSGINKLIGIMQTSNVCGHDEKKQITIQEQIEKLISLNEKVSELVCVFIRKLKT